MEGLGPRHLSRALIAALAALGVVQGGAAQGGAPVEPAPVPREVLERAAWEEHRACVASERLLRFLAHYARATPELRARAVEVLESTRQITAGTHWVPGIDSLRRAESVLADASEAPRDDAAALELDTLGGALDLVAVPGAFEAREEGLTDAVTVLVRRAYPVEASDEFVLALAWRSPSEEDIPARREPIGPEAVRQGAFEMYLRAPATPPAPWRLHGSVSRASAGTTAGVVPEIRVDAVERLRERAAAAAAKTIDGQPGLDRLREMLARLLASGRRASTSLGAQEMLAAIEAWSAEGPPRGLPLPLEPVYTDAQHVEHWLWTYTPEQAPERALVVLAPSTETADLPFSGEIGQRWLELAETSASQLFALHLPPDPSRVAPLLERLRQWIEGRPLVVVARGDSLGRLQLGVEGADELPFDAVAINSAVRGAKPSEVLASVPRLVIAPGAAAAQADGYRGIAGAEVSSFNDLDLPLEVGRWLGDLAAARGAGGGK